MLKGYPSHHCVEALGGTGASYIFDEKEAKTHRTGNNTTWHCLHFKSLDGWFNAAPSTER